MSSPLRQIFLIIIFVALLKSVLGGIDPRLIENKGQWNSAVHFKALTEGGYFYLDDEGITIQQLENGFFENFHNFMLGDSSLRIGQLHTLKLRFLGADLNQHKGEENLGRTENFFIGNNLSKHARNVQSYQRAAYDNIYTNINLRFDIKSDRLKYEYHVLPEGDPEQILIEISHAESIKLKDGSLVFTTSIGEVYDAAPFVYQISDLGSIQRVVSQYQLDGNIISFSFPEGYDTSRELIIDPEISFSTYIGAFSDNFGFTASYDNDGHLYGGAIVYGSDYPIEGGPFQSDFGGGIVDCAITKFSTDGTDLVFSTFLGGLDNDAPHSLVVNDNNELFIYGSTGSFDFPTTSGVYQEDFAGGFPLAGQGLSYDSGSDIFITKISEAGDQLLASTFIGGSGNDGLNFQPELEFNFGDRYRGEIITDDANNIFVASVTASLNFPIVNGFSSNLNSNSNGAVFCMSDDLENLIWSSSSGGSQPEAAYGVQLGDDQTLYITGGTMSNDLPGGQDGANPQNSGDVDGFIMSLNAQNGSLIATTYVGSPSFDQTYFVQIDNDGFVYIVGQSLGNLASTNGLYTNLGSQQFIQKYNPELNAMEWSTRVGSGLPKIDFSPSAFLVTNCNEIYISGWGGTTNEFAQAGGNTNGLPVTDDAFQSTTDGSDFYLMVLDEDAEDLLYATFFGGPQSSEHVDGGTSRFDKNGTVYQAVCAGCTGLNDFPTQTGVWSQTNPSSNCNLGVFKFRLSSVSAQADVNFTTTTLCTGELAEFTNLSEDADIYLWNFGDGSISNETDPTHTYTDPGTYVITLLAEDSEGCLGPDSTSLEIEVLPSPELAFSFTNSPICEGEQLSMGAEGADSYSWEPANLFINSNLANSIFIGSESTTVTLTGTTFCGSQSIQVEVEVNSVEVMLEEEISVCPGESIQLNASGGETYEWQPTEFLDNPSVSNPISTPDTDITYTVQVISAEGCEGSGMVEINLLDSAPILSGETDYATCNFNPVQIDVSGGENYNWTPTEGLSNPGIGNPTANPSNDIIYTVTSTNACGEGSLEILVRTESIDIEMTTDSIGCFRTPIEVNATGGIEYRWSPPQLFANSRDSSTTVQITGTTEISVTGFNEDGCSDTERRLIRLYPRAPISLGRDKIIPFGGETEIEAFTPFDITWEFSEYLSCLDCHNPIASPRETTVFYATIQSPDGCIETDSLEVIVTGNIYVPNAFTPDGDGINDIFRAEGVDITEFKMEIWNRWGDLVFVSSSIEDGWNGSSPNNDFFSPSDIYPYRIVATEHTGELFELEGMVTLIR